MHNDGKSKGMHLPAVPPKKGFETRQEPTTVLRHAAQSLAVLLRSSER